MQPDGIVIRLIEALGYTDLDGEFHAFAGDYLVVLAQGGKMIADASMRLKMKTMSAEERAK